MTTFACQGCKSLTHRCIQAFDKRRIEAASPARDLQEPESLLQGSKRHSPCHFDDPFLLRSFDHCGDAELRPDAQTRPSSSCRLFDLLSKGSCDTAWVGCPSICADQQGPHGLRARPDLLQQSVGQAAISCWADHPCQPQSCG